ncbi:MAG TPA: AMP-binding protein, partial [Homoserinimonas sp.]|nr:AMP-binding protein [Homoserinimonas sp.]
MAQSVYRLFADNLPLRASKAALIDADSGRSATYGQLGEEVDLIADFLAAAGVAAGDRVIVHARKGIFEVAAMLAAWKIGAVVVNVNVQWTAEQLAYVATDCEARALITSREALRKLDLLPPSVQRILVMGAKGAAVPQGCEDASALAPTGQAREQLVRDADLAMIIYTSGSTGSPKGVMLTHANICIGAESVISYLQLGEDDRLLSVLPYSFDAGLNQLTTMLRTGGTVVHQPVALASELIRAVQAHGVTGFAGVPPLWSQVVRFLDEARSPLPSLRYITSTGGKIAPNILERMPAVF